MEDGLRRGLEQLVGDVSLQTAGLLQVSTVLYSCLGLIEDPRPVLDLDLDLVLHLSTNFYNLFTH